MSDDEITKVTLDTVGKLLNSLPDAHARSDACELLLMATYKLMRGFRDDKYVLGWLEAAQEEVKQRPRDLAYRAPH